MEEYRLIKALHAHGVAVPRPFALEESGSVFGSPFLLVERLPGASIGHMYDLPKTRNKRLADDIAVRLAAIHKVPLSAFDNRVSGATIKTSEKNLAWIREGYRNWQALNMPSAIYDLAWEWLTRNVEVNDKAPRTMVHGDYGFNNLLIDGDKVSAILDWEFAHIGNPAYDLGYFWCMADSLSSGDEFLEAYASAGVPLPDKEQLDYNIVFAVARLGVMAGQMAGSFTSGAEPGIAGAAVVGGNYWEETISRLARALELVL